MEVTNEEIIRKYNETILDLHGELMLDYLNKAQEKALRESLELFTVGRDALLAQEADSQPLTPNELCEMEGKPVFVQHIKSPASINDHGEWLILKRCRPDVSHPYVDFGDSSLCFYYYGQSWLAYRRKPEVQNGVD